MSRAWGAAKSVLCVRLDTLGDVLMTTPALRALGASEPRPRLTLLTSQAGAEAARLVPEVGETIVYDAPWLKASRPRVDAAPEFAMAERLKACRFDAAVIFTVYTQSPLPAALLCHLAGIPLRLAHCRENPYGLLTEWVPEPEPERCIRHEVQRQLDLVAGVGFCCGDDSLSLTVPEEARARVAALLEPLSLRERVVVVHPGASAPSRRYAPAGFADAARRLVEEGCSVIFTGAAHEEGLVDEVRALAGAPTNSLAGRLGLAGLAALLERASLLISNNTGPIHVACAVGTPVVDIYALTNPQHTPWGVPHRVLFHDVACRWCFKSVCPEGHHNCLRLVAPDEVVAAALELLEPSARTALP
ncbi:MAG: glycosyltransferase family 9 protein [Actinomycetota bacterium]